MNQNNVVFIQSKITGGHYAFKSAQATKAFQNNMRECTSISLNGNDIVADIGAYVGEYSIWANQNGAGKILSYEATPNTFKILKKNKRENMKIFNLAVVGDNKEYVDLFISKGIGVTNSIVKSFRKAKKIKVKTIKYEQAIKDATIVKIDVEGAEYTYNIIQPQLRGIILEFHPIRNKPWRKWARYIMNNLIKNGFKPIIKPTFIVDGI